MIVTIHQPEHMPWPGFFHKMAQADQYVLLDTVQFETNYWQNRNRIVTREGIECYLTVPVLTKGHTSCAIRDIKINNSEKWRKKYWGRMHNAYCRHPFWKDYCGELEQIVQTHYDFLFDINMALIIFFRRILSVSTPMLRASELSVESCGTALLVDLCRRCRASVYLSGPTGRSYMDMQQWDEAGITVRFHSFTPPVYPAPYYISGLSALDMVMLFGPESGKVIGL